MKKTPELLDKITDLVLSYRPKPPVAKPRKKKSTEWAGAICSTCFRPVVGAGDDWRHLDGRVAHKVVVRQLSR
jgi:hypothetical protein